MRSMKNKPTIRLETVFLSAALLLICASAFAAPTLRYSRNMDENPGWTTEGLWAYGTPLGGGSYEMGYLPPAPDPTSGSTGSNVNGYNLVGDYENNLSERHLTSTAIDCTGLVQVTLKFWRWLGMEEVDDHATISVSKDGSHWTQFWRTRTMKTLRIRRGRFRNWISQVLPKTNRPCTFDGPWDPPMINVSIVVGISTTLRSGWNQQFSYALKNGSVVHINQ